jgi:hypothetical protein
MMFSYISKISNKSFIINLLFSLLVISFIAGNLSINIVIFLIIISSFFFYDKKIFEIKKDIVDKIVIILFAYIFCCSLINNLHYLTDNYTNEFTITFKSIFFLRFLIFYFIVRFLIKNNILNLKLFFLTSFCAVLFVCLDIFYQYFFGYDIFGFKGEVSRVTRRLSGPFGDEKIAGSFIQRFSLIALFAFPIFVKIKKKIIQNLIVIFLIGIFLIGLILAGNRIPLILFVTAITSMTIFEKMLRKYFIPFILLSSLIIILALKMNNNIYYHLTSFQTKAIQLLNTISPENMLTEEEKESYIEEDLFYTLEYKGQRYKLNNTHAKEFNFGYISWKKNKYFGGGLKSSNITCVKHNFLNCSNHPHNYYLEFLSTLGLVGFFIILVLFLVVFYKTFIKRYFFQFYSNNYLLTPFIFLFFLEIFPLKSTGSFFTTTNATYIFLLLPILISLTKVKKFD